MKYAVLELWWQTFDRQITEHTSVFSIYDTKEDADVAVGFLTDFNKTTPGDGPGQFKKAWVQEVTPNKGKVLSSSGSMEG